MKKFFFISYFFPFILFGQTLTGKVIAIKDGDTIEMLVDSLPIRIRLASIDCPEKNQAFGQKAKQFTSDLCFGKIVTAVKTDVDRYGRTIAIIHLPDGSCLNNELLKSGFAWHYKKYSQDNTLAQMEITARENKLGLWLDPAPVAPWEFRHKN